MVGSNSHANTTLLKVHSECLNVLLPSIYESHLADEALSGIELALTGLRAAALQGDLICGANFHSSSLRRYMALKHKISDDARIEAIELLYHLVVADVPVALGVRR